MNEANNTGTPTEPVTPSAAAVGSTDGFCADRRDGPEAAASEIVLKLAGYPSLKLHEWVTATIRRNLVERGEMPSDAQDALRTYRRIWQRIPQNVRDSTMQAMRTWAPDDYSALMKDQKAQAQNK